jgi:hypothetical protein
MVGDMAGILKGVMMRLEEVKCNTGVNLYEPVKP